MTTMQTQTQTTRVPCRAACPVGTHGGGYAAFLAEGDVAGAYHVLRRSNPFAGVCAHICPRPCERACRRSALDVPLELRRLGRFLDEVAAASSCGSPQAILEQLDRPRPRAEAGGRVAVVGAGPAGLACAHDLRLMGHEVVVFERRAEPGGLMRYGVPAFRLPREVVEREVSFILSLGAEVRSGAAVGRDLPLQRLLAEHDAVYLATGCPAGPPRLLPGSDLPGVLSGVEFMALVALGKAPELLGPVAVLGASQLACDVARTVLRLFAASGQSPGGAARRTLGVELVATASDSVLRGEVPDFVAAEEEGVRLLGDRRVVGIREGGGRVVGLATVLEPGSRAPRNAVRRRPFHTSSELPVATVILADGRRPELSFLDAELAAAVTEQGFVRASRESGETAVSGLYAGGDVAFGPRSVVEAVADGRRAALAIDTRLTGRLEVSRAHEVVTVVLDADEASVVAEERDDAPVEFPGRLPIEERTLLREVELPIPVASARAEGRRCLRCWIDATFQASALAGNECLHCGGCVEICPQSCIDLEALRLRAASCGDRFVELDARLRGVGGETSAGDLPRKDDSTCIRCGLCVLRCPSGVVLLRATCPREEWELLAHLPSRSGRSPTWH
ncbi:MAG: FAD-dependent oxidoreductase [Deltaproteobacteria bacterium]|nr:FAD-dependent oxidoreductase [Deltaproteobacteria bacterium]